MFFKQKRLQIKQVYDKVTLALRIQDQGQKVENERYLR